MEFEFTTDHNTAIQVLKQWNIKLLESIPSTCSDKLNEISSFLNQPSSPSSSLKIDRLKSREKQSWSFRRPKRPSVKDERLMRRTGSFSVDSTLSVRGVSPSVPHAIRESLTQSLESNNPSGVLSQESFFTTHVGPNGTMSMFAPPLPPRPAESSSDEDDPDYAYIDENKVKGPDRRSSDCGSPTVDAELEDIEHSIMMEKKKKKRAAVAESKRTMTLGRYPPPRHISSPRTASQLTFTSADPEDYLEPVPSKRLQQSGSPPHDRSPVEVSPTRGEGDRANPPNLPPRTWRMGSTTSNLSTSSVISTGSTGGVSPSVVSQGSVSSAPETSTDDQPTKVHNVIPEEPSTSTMSSQSPKQLDELNPAQRSQSPPSMTSELPPPPLPPRSPIKDRHSHQSSSSSISSTSSSTRCPHCRNKKTKSSLGKTFSLTNHVIHPSYHEELAAKSSLPPDLNKTLPVPENSLCHKQHSRCSHDSSKDVLPGESILSIPSSEYLTLVGDETGTAEEPMSPIAAVESELQSQLEVISNCVQTLEYLETKVSRMEGENGKPKSASQISQEKRAIQTNLDVAMQQTQQVQADLMVPLKNVFTEQPLQNGHTACKRVSGTKGPPTPVGEQSDTHVPPTSSSQPVPASSAAAMNGILTQQQPHWTSPLSALNSPPPIPPRSHVSLGQPKKKLQRQKSSPKQLMTRGESASQSHSVKSLSKSSSLGSNSSLRSYYGTHSQWPNHAEPQSSTVFVHHLGDRRLNHLV